MALFRVCFTKTNFKFRQCFIWLRMFRSMDQLHRSMMAK